jgi:hypothetical protein
LAEKAAQFYRKYPMKTTRTQEEAQATGFSAHIHRKQPERGEEKVDRQRYRQYPMKTTQARGGSASHRL